VRMVDRLLLRSCQSRLSGRDCVMTVAC
jgi:hypothetical protein